MTNQQILKKAIKRAKKDGWKLSQYEQWIEISLGIPGPDIILIHNPRPYHSLIFSHGFAKALWGEEKYATETVGELSTRRKDNKMRWQYHLQTMVLCEKPLEYLAKFLTEPPEICKAL